MPHWKAFIYFHNDWSKEAAGVNSYESIALKLAEADYAWWDNIYLLSNFQSPNFLPLDTPFLNIVLSYESN